LTKFSLRGDVGGARRSSVDLQRGGVAGVALLSGDGRRNVASVSSGKDTMADAEDCVILNRINLDRFLKDFQTSVELFALLEPGGGPPSDGVPGRVPGGEFHNYQIIAARDGALNIYHFGCCLAAIKKQVPASPVHAGKVDAIKLRAARRQFRADFPNIDSVRHGIAHAAELYKSPADMKRNRLRMSGFLLSPTESVFFPSRLAERTYSVGIDGTMFSVQLDQSSVAKLQHIRDLNDEAFRQPDVPAEPLAGD
jgi:hypothetical protein